jgi:phosphoglycolate phosphatase
VEDDALAVRGLIYDHDGTLIDSIDLVVEATNAALADAGFARVTREGIMRGMVYPTVARMGYHAGSEDDSLNSEMARRYYAEAWRIGATAARPYAGVCELLEAIRRLGLPQAMLSNNQGEFIRQIMTAHDLSEFLDPILGEEDVAEPKPSAAGIIEIARRWGFSPRKVLLVGDSTADAGAARAAGCPSVGVTWGTHSRADLADAGFDRLIDRPDELPPLFASFG